MFQSKHLSKVCKGFCLMQATSWSLCFEEQLRKDARVKDCFKGFLTTTEGVNDVSPKRRTRLKKPLPGWVRVYGWGLMGESLWVGFDG